MQLLACWYHNIGPFLERPIGLCFLQGSYLIKASVGSGKSFLFFDGPIFGLYKHSRRPMLHRHATEGHVQVLFQHLGKTYLICRTITMSKSGGDSVVSKLYEVEDKKLQQLYVHVLNRNVESLEGLLKNELQEIPFKSGLELEETLASLLPPQEVIESSSLLLQDSHNIFEMTPSERISIFKHLFGLLGIDQAKDILSDKKKEIIAQRSFLNDISQVNIQFRSFIHELLECIDRYNTQANIIGAQVLDSLLFEDLRITKESLSIESFYRNSESIATAGIISQIKLQRDILVAELATQEQRQKTLLQLQQQEQSLKSSLRQIMQNIDDLQRNINAMDFSELSILQNTKSELGKQLQLLESQYAIVSLQSIGLSGNSLIEIADSIQSKIQEAEMIKLKITQSSQEKENFQQQLLVLQGQYHRFLSQKSTLEQVINKGIVVVCENCHHENYIPGTKNQIAIQQFEHLEKEIASIIQQMTSLETLLSNNRCLDYEKELEQLKGIFTHIPRKKILEDAKIVQSYQKQLQYYDRQIQSFQLQQEKLQHYHQDLIRLQTQKEEIEKQLGTITSQLQEIQKDFIIETKKDYTLDIKFLDENIGLLEKIQQISGRISELVIKNREQAVKIKQLEEQEKIVSDLYTIYSKELMLVVLQDFLPSLELAINANLAQVVDYEIKFELIKKSGDKLELEIFVIDEKGKRHVKSLSGGQKTVLKLVWILSVATMMKSEFLFMDETINNLDTHTIAKVAELIKNFVTYHDMKFYVVTHAPQIQDMEIWTKTIALSYEGF